MEYGFDLPDPRDHCSSGSSCLHSGSALKPTDQHRSHRTSVVVVNSSSGKGLTNETHADDNPIREQSLKGDTHGCAGVEVGESVQGESA